MNKIIASVVLFFSLLSVACAAPVDPTPAPAPAGDVAAPPSDAARTPPTRTFRVDTCAHYEGRTALNAAACPGRATLASASCSATGGELTTSRAGFGGWECDATWTDTQKGGDLCVHLKCDPESPAATSALTRKSDDRVTSPPAPACRRGTYRDDTQICNVEWADHTTQALSTYWCDRDNDLDGPFGASTVSYAAPQQNGTCRARLLDDGTSVWCCN